MSTPTFVRIRHEPMRRKAFGAITTGYLPIGGPLSHAARSVLIENLTDKTLFYSLDGIEDGWAMVPGDHLILDITANKTNTEGFYLAVGELLYVKYEVATGEPKSGFTFLTVFHGD